jgi:hypothetical protein
MANEKQLHDGGCLCGRLRYRINGPIASVGHCHCGMCRRSSGGIVVTWMTVAPERFAFTRGTPAVYQSSEDATRSFCRDCGAQITFSSRHAPQEIDVTLGTLDDAHLHPADRHVFVKDRLAWLHLDEHLPEHREGTPLR